jgi:hypothetical protein
MVCPGTASKLGQIYPSAQFLPHFQLRKAGGGGRIRGDIMDDPNMSDFYGRVARIQKARSLGLGFEAPGTLGRSYYVKPRSRRRAILGPVLFILVCAVLLKGAIYHEVGADSYNQRVSNLLVGDQVDRIGGWLMQEDATTLFVADRISWALSLLM